MLAEQGDMLGRRLHFVDFNLVVTMSAFLIEQLQIGNMVVELPNQSQQNIVADLLGHPV